MVDRPWYIVGSGGTLARKGAATAFIVLTTGDNSQSGDINARDTVGGNVTYQGASGELLVQLVKLQIDKEAQFRMLMVNALEAERDRNQERHDIVMRALRFNRYIIAAIGIAVLVLLIIIT